MFFFLFVCVFRLRIWAPHVCSARRQRLVPVPWDWSYPLGVRHHVRAKNWTQVPCKSVMYSSLLSHLSRPLPQFNKSDFKMSWITQEKGVWKPNSVSVSEVPRGRDHWARAEWWRGYKSIIDTRTREGLSETWWWCGKDARRARQGKWESRSKESKGRRNQTEQNKHSWFLWGSQVLELQIIHKNKAASIGTLVGFFFNLMEKRKKKWQTCKEEGAAKGNKIFI